MRPAQTAPAVSPRAMSAFGLFDGYFVALAGKNLGGSLALALTRIAVHHSTIMSSFGVYLWLESALTGVATPTGTITLALVPLILGFQLLLQAIVLDIQETPK